jgi:hypothetical protein
MTRKVIRNRPLGPFRDGPPIPRPRWQGRGPSRDALRGAGGRTPVALHPLCALIPLDLLLGGRPLRPTTRLSGEGHQSRGPHTSLKRRQQIGALALHASGHHVLEGQYPFLPEAPQHRRRPLGLRLKHPLVGHLALPPSGGIRRAKPDVRQEKPLIDERIPLPRSIPGKDAHLTVLHFPQRPPIVPRHACGVLALCDTARCIEQQDAIGLAQLVRHELMLSTWTKVLPQFTLPENQSCISFQTVGESLQPLRTDVGRTHKPKTVTNNTS